jgi:uncharacterized cupin superfamily protein
MTSWFVKNARDAEWWDCGDSGWYCPFESSEERFPQVGINLNVLPPGGPMSMYHREGGQEDFLVVSGEAILIVEGEERRLRQWDFFHCPPETDHVIVGAGEEPCVVLAVGARGHPGTLVYPVSEQAIAHGAGVEVETREPKEAYAAWEQPQAAPHPDDLLPEL